MKVLIADDSAIIRAMLEHNLHDLGNFNVVASVANGVKALEAIETFAPDFVITDYDMPAMNGLELCEKIQAQFKIPVVIFSEDENIKNSCFSKGARLFIKKPKLSTITKDFWKDMIQKINELGLTESQNGTEIVERPEFNNPRLVVFGASTGGPTCVAEVAAKLGKNFPLPILFVQHIEKGSDKKMVNWFNSVCPDIKFNLAEDGQKALPGNIYMAPAEKHLVVSGIDSDGMPIIGLSNEKEEHFLRPAVNVLFRSAAKFYTNNLLAVLFTGMGRDGAEGCKVVIENGGYTIAEDKSTCVVFGMPAAAIELGAAKEVLPRDRISARLLQIVGNNK